MYLVISHQNVTIIGVIHADFNDGNIIVSEPNTDTEDQKIIGIIDFGDMQCTCYVYEIAITIMYMMLENNVVDFFDVGGHVLAGQYLYP